MVWILLLILVSMGFGVYVGQKLLNAFRAKHQSDYIRAMEEQLALDAEALATMRAMMRGSGQHRSR